MEMNEPTEQSSALEVNGVTIDMDVIAKDAFIELNNNEMAEEIINGGEEKFFDDENEESKPAEENSGSSVEMNAEAEESSTNTSNGEEGNVTDESPEGEPKVDKKEGASVVDEAQSDASSKVATDEGIETNGTPAEDDKVVNLENDAIPTESNTAEGTVTTQANDAADATERVDDPTAASTSGSSTKSPTKKSASKKRKNRTRSKKNSTDYSNMMKYGLHVTQRQRRYFLQVARGVPIPDDDCEIFISNIPINVLEPELLPLFERFGKIFEMRLMMSMRNSKRNAGFAFVRFTSNEAATEATEKLNEYEILPGKHLAIRLSQPNLSLFVGNIHRGLTREQIHEKISSKTTGLVKTFVKSSSYEDTKNCGFCFLQYDCHSAALKAKRSLNRGSVWGRQLFVDWAQRREQLDDNTPQETKTLFINYLPREITDQQITETLSAFGTIEKVTKIKDYAFVLFTEHAAAMNAMNDVDKSKFGNDTVEISIAMPKSSRNRVRSSEVNLRSRHGRTRNNSFNRFNPSVGSSDKFFKSNRVNSNKNGRNTTEQTTVSDDQPAASDEQTRETVERTETAAEQTVVGQTDIKQTAVPAIVITPPEPITVN